MRASRFGRGVQAWVSLIAGLALAMGSCGTDGGSPSDATPTPPAVVTDEPEAPGAEIRPDGVQPSGTEDTIATPPADVALGTVEIATLTRLPQLTADWTTSTLVGPVGRSGWPLFVGVHDDQYVVVAGSEFDGEAPSDQDPMLLTWRSRNGRTWTRTDHALTPGSWISNVVAVDEGPSGLLAVGHRQAGWVGELVILRSDASGRWTELDLRAADVDPVGVSAMWTAAGTNGLLIVGERFAPTPAAPVVADIDGHRLAIDDHAGTFELTEIDDGRVVASGPLTDIYHSSESGQPVWDQATDELVVVIPWDVWEQHDVGSPLPIPIPTPDSGGHRRTVEFGGYRIELDEEHGTFVVTELATGDVVTRGSLEELGRGPAPRFVDAAGDVVLTVSWDEWDELMMAVYAQQPGSPVVASELVALCSTDGRTWTATELDHPPDTYVTGVWSFAERFVVGFGNAGGGADQRTFVVSRDGADWTPDATIDLPEGITASGSAGTVGLSWSWSGSAYGADTPLVWTTRDGQSWDAAFSLITQSDGRSAWIDMLASGRGGRTAIATVAPNQTFTELTITIGSRTARFDEMYGGVEIVDTTTDRVVFATTVEELATADPDEPLVSYADGVTTFWVDGAPVMAIPDDTVWAAYQQRDRDHDARVERVAFVELDGDWFEVALPWFGDGWPAQVGFGEHELAVVGFVEGPFDPWMPSEPLPFELMVMIGALGHGTAAP